MCFIVDIIVVYISLNIIELMDSFVQLKTHLFFFLLDCPKVYLYVCNFSYMPHMHWLSW